MGMIEAGGLLMKTLLASVAVLSLAASAYSDPVPGEKPKPLDDNELFAGAWKLTECELAHNSNPPRANERWIVEKGRIEWKGRIRPVALSYSLDPSKTPKQIDLKIVEGRGTGGVLKGIYKLTDGKLQVCYFLDADKGRPEEFAGTDKLGKPLPGDPVFLILRRADLKD